MVERKIGNTLVSAGRLYVTGNEPLTHKVKQLIFSDKEALLFMTQTQIHAQYSRNAHLFCQLTQP